MLAGNIQSGWLQDRKFSVAKTSRAGYSGLVIIRLSWNPDQDWLKICQAKGMIEFLRLEI